MLSMFGIGLPKHNVPVPLLSYNIKKIACSKIDQNKIKAHNLRLNNINISLSGPSVFCDGSNFFLPCRPVSSVSQLQTLVSHQLEFFLNIYSQLIQN